MEEDSTTHPDEGTIHAWLDGALDAPTTAGISDHVRTCPVCAERVAEARGLIAGASRIVASLDDVPAGTRAGWAQSAPETGPAAAPAVASPRDEGSLWRWLHVTPARAAIAATVLVAIGITMTRTRSGPDEIGIAARSGAIAPPVAASLDSVVSAEASAQSAERDPLLDSALKRNIAIAQPPRAMDAVRRPAIPTPEPSAPAIGLAGVDTTASNRVAVARREVQAAREQRADLADRARVGGAVPAAPTVAAGAVLGKSARDEASTPNISTSGMVAQRSTVGVARQCYRIESSDPGASWGGQSLPLVVSSDSAARSGLTPVRVLDAAGRPTSISAQFIRGTGDSLTLRLRRLGYTGTIELGPDVGGRVGLAFSEPATAQLEQVVVTGQGTEDRNAPAASRAARKATGAGAAAAASAAPTAPPAPAQPSRGAGSRVTMRAVSCPVQ